uniref:NADH-ubiquinone oxidoreductase chain 3 n=1 Tax=Neoscona multiplicans TaxID=1112442 RepID=A0A5B7M1F2_9ARAC|nr:NADH dehydrogenase subunit 3 [Neoscona multiplicans]QCF46303.1 NADH dehydrogenase subunit 3 [Neoscona multiplicans]
MYLFSLMLSFMLVMVMSILFFMISYKKLLDAETFSSYECGFNVKSITRMFFSFRFFLISILFLIFDIEIALMLPIPYLVLGSSTMLTIYLFFLILVLGLMYEYIYGSLNWLNFISKA